ncbi:MAG: c-type cytochrome [Chloroflexota bacterium]
MANLYQYTKCSLILIFLLLGFGCQENAELPEPLEDSISAVTPIPLEILTPTPDSEQQELIGQAIYDQMCAACHGINGESLECFDQNGSPIACAGRPLNSSNLLCGEESRRMTAMGWHLEKRAYIESIIAAGRTESGMPAYSSEYLDGVGLNDAEIDYITDFVMLYETAELCADFEAALEITLPTTVAGLGAGDAEKGEELHNITFGCSACHGDPAVEFSNAVGSWAGTFKDLDNRREGYTAADYVYESIVLPNAHISPDCPTGPCSGPPSGMPWNYAERMTAQELADVMAYLEIDVMNSNGVEMDFSSED